jgi:S-DNA-T family DNA segregation ATPase FtsK/SpoIIIE
MKTDMQNQVEQVDRIDPSLQAVLVKNLGLTVVVGRDEQGRDVAVDLTTLPHLLIGGATGQGKSVFLHSLICSLVQDHSPKEVEFVLMDPKRVEFSGYAKLQHLHAHIVYDPEQGTAMMKHIESVMDGRFSLFAEKGCGNITEYNNVTEGDGLPHTIVVVDEFSDFMCNDDCGVFESTVSRIAALGRTAGIHLVMATSRPTAKVVTGALKANIPGRLSFRAATKVDSLTLLGEAGAEALSRPGSALLKTSNGAVIQVQVPLIRDAEIKEVVGSVLARYSEGEPEEKLEIDCDEALLNRAIELIRTTGRASLSLFQRQLGIGYNAAVQLMDRLGKLPKFKNIRTMGCWRASKTRQDRESKVRQ